MIGYLTSFCSVVEDNVLGPGRAQIAKDSSSLIQTTSMSMICCYTDCQDRATHKTVVRTDILT